MEIRSFLAFDLPADIKEMVAHTAESMKRFDVGVRWVKGNNIHLTVVFLGNVFLDQLGVIEDLVGRVCETFAPFALSLKGCGVFPNQRRPNVLWIGLDGDVYRMSTFRDELQDVLSPLGIKKEKRKFSPHLTLGRFRRGVIPGTDLENLLSKHTDLKSLECVLSELSLFRSELKPTGPIYSVLKTWPLRGER